MEAVKLKKKKGTINKGKVKKTIKNVICRPDPFFWPVITEAEGNVLDTALKKHRVLIPDFKKLHWNELKSIPKNERPKPPPIMKVNGLIFGISACQNAIQNKNCSTVLIEAAVDPQALVQTIIAACTSDNIPMICLKNLRKMTKSYFGIHTSCLGVEENKFVELSNIVKQISHTYKHKLNYHNSPNILENNNETDEIISSKDHSKLDNSMSKEVIGESIKMPKLDTSMDIDITIPYLFRSNKKTRVFEPSSQTHRDKNQFSGQQFIKISENNDKKSDRKAYMNMILKRMSNNANRVKLKPNKD